MIKRSNASQGHTGPLESRRPALPPSSRGGEQHRQQAQELGVVADCHNQVAVASGEDLSFRRPGVPDSVLRKLRRGEYPIAGDLDLHGLTVAQAKHALQAFAGFL